MEGAMRNSRIVNVRLDLSSFFIVRVLMGVNICRRVVLSR